MVQKSPQSKPNFVITVKTRHVTTTSMRLRGKKDVFSFMRHDGNITEIMKKSQEFKSLHTQTYLNVLQQNKRIVNATYPCAKQRL